MAKMKHFPFGAFSWVDLVTTDDTAAVKFYSELLGWTDTGSANPENGFYHMMTLGEGSAGAIFPLNEQMQKQNVPPHWNSYIQVENADATTQKATENGAKVLMAPFDVFTHGRMAVLADPTGAIFQLWQPKDSFGVTPMDNKPGTFCWNELLTQDPEKAKTFYSTVFGWDLEDSTGSMGTYTTIKNNGRLNGGIMKTPQEGMPSYWGVYFAVSNCDEGVKKVESLGGKTIMPPFDIPEVGRISVVQDPQGAFFSIVSMLTPEET